jgi:hypothetical protein
MKAKSLLTAAGLLAFVAGCTTTPVKVSRAPITAVAHFTLPCLDVSQVEAPPKVTRLDHPVFRLTNPADGAGEYAIVQFIIDAEGIPREVQWVEASDAGFARAAAASAADSRYSPAKLDGKAVAAKVELRYEVRYAGSTPTFYVGDRTGETRYAEQTPSHLSGNDLNFWH